MIHGRAQHCDVGTPTRHTIIARCIEMPDQPSIILFDGVCNLCNGIVQFVIRRDPSPGVFQFAALQSPAGQRMLRDHGLPTADLDTFVLIDGGRASVQSTAALRTLKRLGLPWSLMHVFIIVPRPLRDLIYRFIARNRYRWFGCLESCMTPSSDVLSRFVQD